MPHSLQVMPHSLQVIILHAPRHVTTRPAPLSCTTAAATAWLPQQHHRHSHLVAHSLPLLTRAYHREIKSLLRATLISPSAPSSQAGLGLVLRVPRYPPPPPPTPPPPLPPPPPLLSAPPPPPQHLKPGLVWPSYCRLISWREKRKGELGGRPMLAYLIIFNI